MLGLWEGKLYRGIEGGIVFLDVSHSMLLSKPVYHRRDLLGSVMGLAERSRDNFPEEILIRFDLRTFLYHWFLEPLTGRRKSVFPSRTNQTGVECSRRVFLPMTVIRSSSEASSAF